MLNKMKNKSSNPIAFLVLFALIQFMVQCTNEKGCTDPTATNYNSNAKTDDSSCTYKFQGPKNPGFELNDSSWMPVIAHSSKPTGFMPTEGSFYRDIIIVRSNPPPANVYLYQDSVDFSHTAKLLFDYETSYGSFTDHDSVVTVRLYVLFTTSVTDTLWSKTINSKWDTGTGKPTMEKLQVKGEAIILPKLPNKGRLKFCATADVVNDSKGGTPLEKDGFKLRYDGTRPIVKPIVR